MQDEVFILKASDSANWGFLIFGIIGAGLAYGLDHTFLDFLSPLLYMLAGGFATFSIASPVFWQKKRTLLFEDKMLIYKGLLFNNPKKIVWNELRAPKITFLEGKGKITKDLTEIDIEDNKEIKIEAINFVLSKGDSLTFNNYEFEDADFKEFVKQFKKLYQAYLGEPPIPQKIVQNIGENTPKDNENQAIKSDNQIDIAIQRCENYLKEDKLLINELKEAMNEAYSSIYQLHTLHIDREGDELRLQKNDVIFSYQINEDNYHFYLKENYKPSTEEAEIQTVEKLIKTSLYNIGIVEARIKVYQEILLELGQTQAKYLQRLKLQEIANKINHLQQRNIQQSDETDELSFDTQSIVQLELLTEKVKKADLELYAETLIQHANLIKNNALDENQNNILLKHLDEKLK
jgi:hypothetical protein